MERCAADVPPPQTNDPQERMLHRLGTRAGRALYGLRKHTVEPVFGIIKLVIGWRQLSLRGPSAHRHVQPRQTGGHLRAVAADANQMHLDPAVEQVRFDQVFRRGFSFRVESKVFVMERGVWIEKVRVILSVRRIGSIVLVGALVEVAHAAVEQRVGDNHPLSVALPSLRCMLRPGATILAPKKFGSATT